VEHLVLADDRHSIESGPDSNLPSRSRTGSTSSQRKSVLDFMNEGDDLNHMLPCAFGSPLSSLFDNDLVRLASILSNFSPLTTSFSS
jgi:hypothetical protein